MPLHPECLLTDKEYKIRDRIRNTIIKACNAIDMKLTEGQADMLSNNVFYLIKSELTE